MPFVQSSETRLGCQLTSPGKSTAELDTNWAMVENSFCDLQHKTCTLIIMSSDSILKNAWSSYLRANALSTKQISHTHKYIKYMNKYTNQLIKKWSIKAYHFIIIIIIIGEIPDAGHWVLYAQILIVIRDRAPPCNKNEQADLTTLYPVWI